MTNDDTELQHRKPPTRREAMLQGRRRYRGRPCPTHGDVLRYTTSSTCVACALASAAATRERERAQRLAMWDEDIEPEESNPNPN